MPSKSAKQHRLMALVANDPKAAKRLGIPQSVGRDFIEADKGRKFNSGGLGMRSRMSKDDLQAMQDQASRRRMVSPARRGPLEYMKKGGKAESKKMVQKELAFMKKKGAPKAMIRHEEEEMEGKKMQKFRVGGPPRGRGAAPAPGSLASMRNHPNPNIAMNAWAKGQKTMGPIYQRTGYPKGGSPADSNYQYDPAYDPAFEPSRAVEPPEDLQERQYAHGGKIQKFSGQTGSYVRRSGPTSREATGPTSGRATYFPNPFGKSIKVYTGPTGGAQSRTPSSNPRDIFGNENPNFSNELAEMEEERRRQQPMQYARGGSIKSHKGAKSMSKHKKAGMADKAGRAMKKRTADTMGRAMVKGYKEGGSVHSSYRKGADGIANKGKTKGKIVKMRYGGEC